MATDIRDLVQNLFLSKKVPEDCLELWTDEAKAALRRLECVSDKIVSLLSEEHLTVGESQIALNVVLNFILESPVASPNVTNGR